SITPGGTRIVISSCSRVRPSPEHFGHGDSTIVPSPWQRSQVVTLIICPKRERCTERTWPEPAHWGQVFVLVPGLAPEPLHSVQGTMRRILMTFAAPFA